MKLLIAILGISIPLLGHAVQPTNNESAAMRQAADQGDSEAQRKLAALFFVDGKAGNLRLEEAAKYLQQSIEQGNMTALADLGLYSLYTMTPDDNSGLDQATAAIAHSAGTGNAVGQMRLGRMYSLGLGVPKDAKLARHWLTLSAEQGNADAKAFLKNIYNIDINQAGH